MLNSLGLMAGAWLFYSGLSEKQTDNRREGKGKILMSGKRTLFLRAESRRRQRLVGQREQNGCG